LESSFHEAESSSSALELDRYTDIEGKLTMLTMKELEEALAKTQEDSAIRISALNTERDDLKALLLATLQRLEAVDEMVHRADLSSTMMQDKVSLNEFKPHRASCSSPSPFIY
jgi:hypothetical protein